MFMEDCPGIAKPLKTALLKRPIALPRFVLRCIEIAWSFSLNTAYHLRVFDYKTTVTADTFNFKSFIIPLDDIWIFFSENLTFIESSRVLGFCLALSMDPVPQILHFNKLCSMISSCSPHGQPPSLPNSQQQI
ncbi:hypothetical protein AVEN_200137-1 [Araneus ventricosus]|uniref:Uncharacterized protein n=1 Tax=Araneus ventricosus TaxID=182803 RepID=A0A4Y2N6J2_ARAVE|nr:hypothetical protein AVEN_200137-1 [Araneus ventricosus]